jgi:hypothetical protein
LLGLDAVYLHLGLSVDHVGLLWWVTHLLLGVTHLLLRVALGRVLLLGVALRRVHLLLLRVALRRVLLLGVALRRVHLLLRVALRRVLLLLLRVTLWWLTVAHRLLLLDVDLRHSGWRGDVLRGLTCREHYLRRAMEGCGVDLLQLLAIRVPLGSKMDGASLSAFVLNFEPLIKARANTEGRNLYSVLTNQFRASDILIETLQMNVIADILHVNFEALVPSGGLALVLGGFSSDALLAGVDNDVGVHLAECFGVSGKFCV